MKILLATHFFPPGHLGGTEVLTLGLAKNLLESGCKVQVVCNEDWDTAPGYRVHETKDRYQEIPVRRLHYNWTKAPDVFRYLYQNPEVYQYFKRLLKEERFDILHITSLSSLSASVIQAAHEAGIPIVFTATDFWFVCIKNTLLRGDGSLCPGQGDPWECTKCRMQGQKAYESIRRLLPEKLAKTVMLEAAKFPFITNLPGFQAMLGDWEKRFHYQNQMLRNVDRIVTASKFLKDLYLNYQVLDEKIVYSAYGLDTTWARGYTTKTESSNLRIGFIGQLIPIKGVELLLHAVQSIDQDLPIEIKIYGDLRKNPDYGAALVAEAGQDRRISFLGTFDNQKMGEVMSGIDVLVVPSTWYDFPLVIPSALATHTPVIATDLPGMNELVRHEQNGLLFERSDWQELAEQIERLVKEKALIARLKKGIEPVKTVAEMGMEYREIYSQMVRG
jgi:glycosyltransferase involved in cell wall biosynthesis